jgi:hypothetical protein
MPVKVIICVLGILAGSFFAQRSLSQAGLSTAANFQRLVPTQKRMVIAASRLLDGKGQVVHTRES